MSNRTCRSASRGTPVVLNAHELPRYPYDPCCTRQAAPAADFVESAPPRPRWTRKRCASVQPPFTRVEHTCATAETACWFFVGYLVFIQFSRNFSPARNDPRPDPRTTLLCYAQPATCQLACMVSRATCEQRSHAAMARRIRPLAPLLSMTID